MNKDQKKNQNSTLASKKETQATVLSSEDKKEVAHAETNSVHEKKETEHIEKDVKTVPELDKDSTLNQGSKPQKLNTIFAYKMGMTNIYDDQKNFIPVTVLKYRTCKVTQIKTKETDGYEAVQIALESSKKANKAQENHLKKAGFQKRARFVREVRCKLPEGLKIGQEISIESVKKGDFVQVSGISKGHGFSGVVKRWGFGGGPASHGAEKQRTTGSVANTATQGKVFPGKKMPGHFGCDRVTVRNVEVIQVIPSRSAILLKGPIPGAVQSLTQITQQIKG